MQELVGIGRNRGPSRCLIAKQYGYQIIVLYKADIASSDVDIFKALLRRKRLLHRS